MLDLFSGIGGFSLAARWTGRIKTTAFCEIDPYCQQVLTKNFHGVRIFSDVRGLRGEEVGPIDIITGGFPCQPFSVAGKKRGTADNRHLWPEMRRLAEELRPAWILGENVAGFVTMALDDVLSDLEAIDYKAIPFVVPACAVDAPHRRDRVWIVAHAEGCAVGTGLRPGESGGIGRGRLGDGSCADAISDASLLLRRSIKRDESDGDVSSNGDVADPPGGRIRRGFPSGETGQPSCGGENVPHSDKHEHEGCPSSNGREAAEKLPSPDTDRTGREEQRGSVSGYQEYPPPKQYCEWPPEPGVGRVAHGISRRVDRLKGLGNAIVPQVAYEILMAILKAEARA